MGAKARVNFRSRISLAQLHERIRAQLISSWPLDLANAGRLLTSELEVSYATARLIVLKSTSAARVCVAAQNQQLRENERARTQKRLQNSCKRVVNCIKRGPTAVRRRLDFKLPPLIKKPVDLEVLESVFETARKIFKISRNDAASKTAFRSLQGLYFSTLSAAAQGEVADALAAFKAKGEDHRHTASRLFAIIAETIGGKKNSKTSRQVGHHIKRYLEKLVTIWLQAGLKPTIGHDYLHLYPTAYRSQFHEFAELVLLSNMRPSEVSDGRRAHGADRDGPNIVVSRTAKPWIEASLRGKKYKWIVSYEHLRSVLRRR
jgi:hypothetical protein